jgi:hypothetical protein
MNINKSAEKDLSMKLCRIIFLKKYKLSSDEINELNKLFESYTTLDLHAPYDEISRYVYSEKDIKVIKGLSQSVDEKISNGVKMENDKYKAFHKSIIRHINLAVIQRSYIDETSKEASNVASDIAYEAKDVSNEAKKVKDKIYTDFITILGIFTAITFATFGGLQLLSNIFDHTDFSSLKNLGGSLFLGSCYIVGIYLILIVLLTGIKKLSQKNSEYIPSDDIKKQVYLVCFILGTIGVCLYIFGMFFN